MAGLRTWWLPAVGTSDLYLHVSPSSLAIGWTVSVDRGPARHRLDGPAARRGCRPPPSSRADGHARTVEAGPPGAAVSLSGEPFSPSPLAIY